MYCKIQIKVYNVLASMLKEKNENKVEDDQCTNPLISNKEVKQYKHTDSLLCVFVLPTTYVF